MRHLCFSCTHCETVLPMGTAVKLRRFLISGQTKMDLEGICVGSIDEPLCELGRRNAVDAAVRLAAACQKNGEKIDRIFSSPMKRATATGMIFSSRLGVMLATENLLAERDLGEAEGKPDNISSISLLRYWDAPEGATQQKKFEQEAIVFLDWLSTPGSRFESYSDILFITHKIRLLTLIKIMKGYTQRQINKMSKYSQLKNCDVMTFGIGRECEKCGNHFYEPLN